MTNRPIERCPTCESLVTVVSSDEGTSHYVSWLTAASLDVIAHAVRHAEVFLREILATGPPETHLSVRDHARAHGHADELGHALRLITGGYVDL